MNDDITKDERARVEALAHAVRQPSDGTKNAEMICADAEKFRAFLMGSSATGGQGVSLNVA